MVCVIASNCLFSLRLLEVLGANLLENMLECSGLLILRVGLSGNSARFFKLLKSQLIVSGDLRVYSILLTSEDCIDLSLRLLTLFVLSDWSSLDVESID